MLLLLLCSTRWNNGVLEQARTEWGTELRERDESEKTRFISIRLNLNTLLRLLLIRFVHIKDILSEGVYMNGWLDFFYTCVLS